MRLIARKTMLALLALLGVICLPSHAMRDPTEPPMQNLEKKDSVEDKRFKINAIIISSDRRLAVINGQTLKVGDTIDGVKVKKIERGTVQLLDGTTLIEVQIHKKIKEPVNNKPKTANDRDAQE